MSYNLKIDGIVKENVKTISALTEDGSFGIFKAVNDIKASDAGAFKWGFTQRSSSEEYVIEISGLGFIPSGFLILLAPEIGWDSSTAADNNQNFGGSSTLSSLIYFIGEDENDPSQTIHQRIIPQNDNGAKSRVNPNTFTPIISGDSFKIKKASDPYNPMTDVRYFWIAWG